MAVAHWLSHTCVRETLLCDLIFDNRDNVDWAADNLHTLNGFTPYHTLSTELSSLEARACVCVSNRVLCSVVSPADGVVI